MSNDPVSININEVRNRYLAGTQGSEVNTQAVNQMLNDINEAAAQTGGRVSAGFEDSTPLSRDMTAALADVGVHGFRTHGEVREHVRGLAEHLGLTPGATKKTGSRRGLSNRAEEALSRLGTKGRRSLSGDEASLLDEAHTVHLGIKHLMRNVPERGNSRIPDITEGRNPATALTPSQIESQSLDVTPEMQEERNRTEPVGPSSTQGVRLPPGTIESDQPSPGRSPSVRERTRPDYTPRSGRPLINLPAVPKPMTEGMKPGQIRYRQSQYNKTISERQGLMERLSAERVSRSAALTTGVGEATKAGLMWSFDPDDGGWAHRPIDAPVGSLPASPSAEAPTPKSASKTPKNPPIPLSDMVGAILQGEKDILEARSKYPESDNPMPGFR